MEKLSRDQKGSSKGLSFRLDDNLYAVIENYADVTGNNMAEMTRQLLRGALMQLEANQEDRRSVQLVGPPDEKGNPTGLVKIANDRDASEHPDRMSTTLSISRAEMTVDDHFAGLVQYLKSKGHLDDMEKGARTELTKFADGRTTVVTQTDGGTTTTTQTR